MIEELSGTMEKKSTPRQQPTQSKSSVATERKTEPSNKFNGRRRWKDNGSPGGRSVEPAPTSVKPPPKWNKGNGDKRPRQRGYYNSRQREEVAEGDDTMDVFSTASRKGDAKELLRFHFSPRDNDSRSFGRWTGYRGSGGRYRKAVRYNKEQFLQASCQFVVRDEGEYSQQAVDPDALVKWEMVELVRIFSTEPVQCPICLEKPLAGKITKCGHIYCWACMLRYLALGEKDYRKCPICYDSVVAENLKSVQWIEVPDFKVGDSIEMKLMQKSKGSVNVCPKSQWKERNGIPLNLQEGENTRFAKLLVAKTRQIMTEVIELEKAALDIQLADSEEEEQPFIAMAQEMLKSREESLLFVKNLLIQNEETAEQEQLNEEKLEARLPEPIQIPSEDSEVATYVDAFDDELESNDPDNSDPEIDFEGASLDLLDASLDQEKDLEEEINEQSLAIAEALPEPLDLNKSPRQRGDSECSLPFGSPVNPFPLLEHQPVSQPAFTTEEVFDNLELPPAEVGQAMKQAKRAQIAKDTYYFYQAGTGQHIYMHSLNARCLQEEYGCLENGPETISAKIVAIKRMFMTEDVRKRLRYLNHIPLTCEFHVVELDLKAPILSKDTVKKFRGDIDKLRRERQKKAREDKMRARENELEHKKAHGIYPEINLQLDNQNQFPSHLSARSPPKTELSDESSEPISPQEILPNAEVQTETDWGPQTGAAPISKTSAWEATSFAQIAGSGAWPSVQRWHPPPEPKPAPRVHKSSQVESDDETLAAPSYSASMAADISNLIDAGLRLSATETEEGSPVKGPGGKKKKKKEKQLLFSTSMARKI